jgi:hydrogenase expression/formation protein HypC
MTGRGDMTGRRDMTGDWSLDAGCADDHCVTCGDVAVQVTVTTLLPGDLALVAAGQGVEPARGAEIVSVALVSAAPGDTILVHAGEAIAVVGR